MSDTPAPVLELDRLTTSFRIGGTWHPAVRDISFSLMPDETLALVGGSGCGKSITALSIMRLLAEPPMRITAGRPARLSSRQCSAERYRQVLRQPGVRIGRLGQQVPHRRPRTAAASPPR